METLTKPRRTRTSPPIWLTVLAFGSQIFPLLTVCSVYAQWCLSWIILGHRPRTGLDHPASIAGAEWLHGITLSMIGKYPIAGLVSVMLGLAFSMFPQPMRRVNVFWALYLFFWFGPFVWAVVDPSRVFIWWLD